MANGPSFGTLAISPSMLKITLIFASDNSGWSETYYAAGSTEDFGATIVGNLVDKRVDVLGFVCRIVAARWGYQDPTRKPNLYMVNRAGNAQVTLGDPAMLQADQPHVAVLAPCKTGAGVRRFLTLSGIPDDWLIRTDPSTPFILSGEGTKRVNTFYRWLLGTAFGMQIRIRRSGGNYEPQGIQSISVGTDGRYLVSLVTGGIYPTPGTRVSFAKIKGNNLQYLAGIRRVHTLVPGVSFTVDAGPRSDLGEVVYRPGGTARQVEYDFAPAFSTKEGFRVSTRKRGRPFAARRGRRSAKR